MEDIGGGERDRGYGKSAVDSAMLDLLDGIKVNFKLPTLIIATTNHPESMIGALADRPGRFDNILKIDFPSSEERVKIVEFIAKRALEAEEKEYISHSRFKDFSIAYLKEAVVRSMLHRKTLQDTFKELIEHKNRFKRDFEENDGEVGF
jgi:AAA+ superfamily predicted ATPase